MATYKVYDSKRKKKRELGDALGNNIMRYIAELLTNSDDSYRREEERGNMSVDDQKPIYIEIKKDRRGTGDMIIVTDNAEGMSSDSLKENFISYEDDKAGGDKMRVRGLYGRGASDVLRVASYEKKTALIETIKDGNVSKLKYNTDEDSLEYSITIDELNLNAARLNNFRKSVRIPNNGTRVSFGIPEKVKYNKTIKKDLKNLIETYPYFRYLLNKPNRKVILNINGKESILSSKAHSFENMEFLTERSFKYNFEGKELDCILKIYRNDNKNVDGTDILVIDSEEIVYDNTMFDFSNHVSAKNISGVLIIDGLYDVCYDYLNKKDIAIFNVNRTGFDNKNPFYINLNKLLSPILNSILVEHGTKVKNADLTNNKQFSDVLKKLNKYITSELKDSITGGNLSGQEPPAEGIKFVRSNATITVGKTYDLKLLINSTLVETNDNIDITVEPNNNIDVSPHYVNYEEKDIRDNGLVVKDIIIKSLSITNAPILIEAKYKNYLAVILINVIEQEIHDPLNGFEFYPNKLILSPDNIHKTPLYFDKNILPLGSVITFEAKGLELSKTKHLVVEEDLIDENIGCIIFKSKGGLIGGEYQILARAEGFVDLSTSVKISIVEPSKNKNIGGGLISSIKLEFREEKYQSYYNTHTHELFIIARNKINEALMGSMEDKNPSKPSFTKNQRKYLCDIIAQQAALILVKENARLGEIHFEDSPHETIDALMNHVVEHKMNIFNEISPILID